MDPFGPIEIPQGPLFIGQNGPIKINKKINLSQIYDLIGKEFLAPTTRIFGPHHRPIKIPQGPLLIGCF